MKIQYTVKHVNKEVEQSCHESAMAFRNLIIESAKILGKGKLVISFCWILTRFYKVIKEEKRITYDFFLLADGPSSR